MSSVAFKILRDVDPNLVRVQQNVAQALEESAASRQPSVLSVTKSTRVPDAADIVAVSTQLGPVTLTLTDTRKTPLTIVCTGPGNNAVTIEGQLRNVRRQMTVPDAVTLLPVDGAYYPISRYPSASQ